MKITNLIYKPINIKLRIPFEIAYMKEEIYEGVIIKIETDEGIYGFGEASPSIHITGENTKTVIDALEIIKPLIINENPIEIEKIMDKINNNLLYNTATKAAIDIALYDIKAKYFKTTIKDLLGGYREKIVTSITIGIMGIDDMVKEATRLVNEGAKVIKLKIGKNTKEDIERVKILRETIGENIGIRVDANQGYTPADAVFVLNNIEKYNIQFCEQPVFRYDYQGLKYVKNKTNVPIMVDESLHSIYDAIRLIKEGACDMFNIKLMKSGGINEAMKIISIAEGANIPCMVGCMTETKVGTTAATHLALAMKNVIYADIDGHLLLAEDIVEGGVITSNGENKVNEKVGLGISNIKIF